MSDIQPIIDPILDPIIGPMMPYGTPIRDAIARGDELAMRRAGENARQWLARNAAHANAPEVRRALDELNAALPRGR